MQSSDSNPRRKSAQSKDRDQFAQRIHSPWPTFFSAPYKDSGTSQSTFLYHVLPLKRWGLQLLHQRFDPAGSIDQFSGCNDIFCAPVFHLGQKPKGSDLSVGHTTQKKYQSDSVFSMLTCSVHGRAKNGKEASTEYFAHYHFHAPQQTCQNPVIIPTARAWIPTLFLQPWR